MTPNRAVAQDVFSRALELPAEQRSEFLDQQCGSDPQLRADVESLLSWHELAQADNWEISADPDSPATTALAEIRARTLKRAGPFELETFLGEGATGIVYRARDTRNGGIVALKIASPNTMVSPASRDRFLRSAEAAIRIEHPHVARVYETGSVEGLFYVALEYVEGRTLAKTLKAGALDPAAVVPAARQIAGALQAAHRHRIIHRDLKPANVMIGDSGGIKILDFGLCHAFDRAESIARTESGVALGTLGYMAPEQARGETPTEQSDVFSFGAVLYEMLSGRAAFRGHTPVAILSSVLHDQPDALVALSWPMDLALWCLEKNPARRPGGAARVIAELDRIASGGATIALHGRRFWLQFKPQKWKALAAAGLIAAMSMATPVVLSRRKAPPSSGDWVQMTGFPDSVSQPALSPDGSKIAFIRGPGTWADAGQIYVKDLPDGQAIQLTNDDSKKMSPVFTPDGAQIAYSTVQRNVWDTWLVSSRGGSTGRWLSNAACPMWFGPGRFIFSKILDHDVHMAIVTGDGAGSDSRPVYVPENARAMAHRSYPSPDGKWALVVEMDAASNMLPCRLVPLDGSSAGHSVGPAAPCTVAAWSRDGKWMYFSSAMGGSFHTWRQSFPGGVPQQLTSGPTEEEGIAMSPEGHSFITAVGLKQSSLWLHDFSGERQISKEGFSFDPKLTPDGRFLCYRVLKGTNPYTNPSDFAIVELASGQTHQPFSGLSLIGGPGLVYDISPDGQWAVAAITIEGKQRLVIAPLDAHAPPRVLAEVEGGQPLFENGESILLHAGEPPGNLWRVRRDGTGLQRIAKEPTLFRGNVSPDGRWLPLRLVRPDGYANVLFSLRGQPQIEIAPSGALDYSLRWAPGADRVALSVSSGQFEERGRTYVVPLTPGKILPPMPVGGFHSEAELAALPGAVRIDSWNATLGPASLIAFSRETLLRNLFRVPIP